MFWFHHESHADSFRKIAISFFILSLILIGVVFYISFSWATVTVTPKPVVMQEGFVIDVLEQEQGADSIQGTIIEKDLEVKGTFQPSGELSQALERARGTITVVNQSKRNQPLRTTTRLQMADGTLFRTLQYVSVPAGERVEVPVLADEAKALEDLTSTRFILPGLQSAEQSLIYGVGFSVKAVRSSVKKVLSQIDIDSALASLQDELKLSMTSLLETEFAASNTLQKSAYRITVSPTTVTRSADVNDTVESFTIRMAARVRAVVYDREILKEKIMGQLTRKLGLGYDLLIPSDSDISTEIEAVDTEQKRATLKVVIQASRIRNADSPEFTRSTLSGLSAEAIQTYFRSFPDIVDADVQFYPFWVTSAPYLIDHIHILLKK